MRFDKGNCRKKRVFSQPDVLALQVVWDLISVNFRICQIFQIQNNFKLSQMPKLLVACVELNLR